MMPSTWQMEARHLTRACSILARPRPRRALAPPTPSASSSRGPNQKPIYCSTKYPSWDPNAETVGPRKFNFNSRGKEGEEDEVEDDDLHDYGKKGRWWSDESQGIEEGTSGVWEDAIDSAWVFKAFKSYFWTLPFILLSYLLATDPKAFLMALALPLGQSALTLAFEILWGRAVGKPKQKSRLRKYHNVSGIKVEQEPETQKARKGEAGYKSWVVENNGSVDKGNQETPSFGGWDDLDRSGPASRSSGGMDLSQRMPPQHKLSKRERKSETPLLLRLLIAIFPFLGTWTKML